MFVKIQEYWINPEFISSIKFVNNPGIEFRMGVWMIGGHCMIIEFSTTEQRYTAFKKLTEGGNE